jgi:hypothetical protein
MINSEPFNKYINKRDGIDKDSYLVYLKQDNIDLMNHFLNKESESINSWSSKKHDKDSWGKVMAEIRERHHSG